MNLVAPSQQARGSLGPYILLKQIAVGGMAEIYLAKTSGVAGFEKLLCLKVIHPNLADDEHFTEMLIDEAKIAVGLNHPNIVQIFDLGRDDKTYFIAMEYIDGADLFQVMRSLSEKDIHVPLDVAVYIAQEICNGLDYAHRKRDENGRPLSIIHRDISPQNILISINGEIKIVDFGIAKAASRSGSTQAGVIKGKYYYMSPEQAWGDPLDVRTDVFSTGIILYEVLTGQMLYLEEDVHRLLDRVRKADIPLPTTRRIDIPRELECIVMKALAKRPEDRWQTAHDFQLALTNYLVSYAPDFSPTRVLRLLKLAIDDSAQSLSPPPTSRQPATTLHSVGKRHLMSRIDANAVTEYSVIFPLPNIFPSHDTSQISSNTEQNINDLEGRNEPTIVSAPPAMFKSVITEDNDPKVWDIEDNEDGPTLVANFPLLDARGEQRTSEPSPSVNRAPLEIIVPSSVIRPPGGALPRKLGEEISGDTSRTMVQSKIFPPQGFSRTSGPQVSTSSSPSIGRPASVPPPIPSKISSLSAFKPNVPSPSLISSDIPASNPVPSPSSSVAKVSTPPTALNEGLSLPSQPIPWASVQSSAVATSPIPQKYPNASLDGMFQGTGNEPEFGGESRINQQQRPTLQLSRDLRYYAIESVAKQRSVTQYALIGILLFSLLAGAGLISYHFLFPSIEEGKVNVISVPEGATVIFNGKELSQTTPMTISVPDTRRNYTLEVKRTSYKPYKHSLTFTEGETSISVLAVLTPIFGQLTVRTQPAGADIYIDGEHRGKSPVIINNLTPTTDVTLEIRKRGYKPATHVVKWEGQTYRVAEFDLQRMR